jgi:hypothetical protein
VHIDDAETIDSPPVSSPPDLCRHCPCFYFKTFSDEELFFRAFLANPLMMLSQKTPNVTCAVVEQ